MATVISGEARERPLSDASTMFGKDMTQSSLGLVGPLEPSSHLVKMVTLSPTDLAVLRHAIGAPIDEERQAFLHPKSSLWPPAGLPTGLYKDVILSRTVSQYQFYFCAILFNTALVVQLIIGACVTALASSVNEHGEAITIIAATNTVITGLLALMHNSGLPNRYKKDWQEFEKVEMFLKELIDAGIVCEGVTKDEVIADCYEKFQMAKVRASIVGFEQ